MSEEVIKEVGVLNKFSLGLTALVDKTYRTLAMHVTSDFTEVTNGHYAMRISNVKIDPKEYPLGPNKETVYEGKLDVVLPVDVATRLQKNLPVKCHIPILQNAVPVGTPSENSVEFVTYDLEIWGPVRANIEDTIFPNVDAVKPKDKPEFEIGVDPDYIIKLCQQFKKNKVNTVRLAFRGQENAIEMTGTNDETGQELWALLMPKKLK